jgi:hypothetical protein
MKHLTSLAAAGLIFIGFSTCAGAQGTGQAPDLKGRWVGKGEAIVLGNAPHHASDPASQHRPRMSSPEFTITIEGQEGRRFWGVASSQHHKEPVIGIIGFDGKTVSMQDTDGTTDGTLSDPDTLEVVYRHTAPHSTVLSMNRLKRQK